MTAPTAPIAGSEPPREPAFATGNDWPRPALRIWLAIAAGPLAWGAQIALVWFVEGLTCLRGQLGPSLALSNGTLRGLQAAISLLCIAAVAAALVTALAAWRHDDDEHRAGEIQAHTRPQFLAAIALLVSSVFLVATLWVALSQVWLPLCEKIR